MDAKTKAKELMDRFRPHTNNWDCYNDIPEKENHAKKAALICVDEMLIENEKVHGPRLRWTFWILVKEELLKIK